MLSGKLTLKIASTIKEARKKRRLSQREIAERLDITQARYSQIENGKGSFSAEQLIELIRFFNIPLSEFEVQKKIPNEEQVLQNAIAHFGGRNLYEASDLLPSERFDKLNSIILETMVSRGSSRLLTNLALVLVKNVHDVNFQWIETRLFQRGYLNRWGWLLENTLEALKRSSNYNRRVHGKAHFKISHELDLLKLEWKIDGGKTKEAILDDNISSTKTINMITAERSELSRNWKIISRIQVEDFKKVLDEGLI